MGINSEGGRLLCYISTTEEKKTSFAVLSDLQLHYESLPDIGTNSFPFNT